MANELQRKNIEGILESGKLSDVSFILGEEKEVIHAHKLLLGITSPVFEAMFYGSLAHDTKKPIEITDISPKAFKSLLKYVYTYKITYENIDEALELCFAAKKYMIPALIADIVDYIDCNLTPNDVCRLGDSINLLNEKLLIETCRNIFQLQTRSIIDDPLFKEASLEVIKMLVLNQNCIDTREISLWDALVEWATKECERKNLECNSENKRLILSEFLPEIRFLSMTPEEFVKGPAISNILTNDESRLILMNLIDPGIASIPPNLSSNENSRSQRRHYSHQLNRNYYQ